MAYITFQPSDHFNTKLYTGNSSTQAITGVGFQPDLTWIKRRDATTGHELYDAVRGVLKEISSDSTAAETTDPSFLSAFGTDGFTVGNHGGINNNGNTYVSWNWKAGGGAGSANTDGSINTTYTSVNTTAGFSISKWTGNSTAGATIGHGLGVKPNVIIIKNLGATTQWLTWFDSFANTEMIYLNLTNAKGTSQTYFNSTTPTSSLITLGGGADENQNTMIAYCFAEKTGFSKFGTYTGNGSSNSPFVYTGMKPSFVIIKKATGSTADWVMIDNKRGAFNIFGERLYPNLNSAEDTSGDYFSFFSNGFKAQDNVSLWNNNNSTYLYMAFAEEPLVASNGTPATAR